MKALEKLSKIVVDHRMRAGWTQAQLAAEAGVGTSTVARIEQARGDFPERLIIEKIAKAVGKVWNPEGVAFVNGTDIPAGIDPIAEAFPIPEWEIDIAASAWVEIPICQLDTDDPEQIRAIRAGRFRLRIKGRCMEPEYPDGSIVEFQIMRVDEEELIEGRAYVVCRNDGTGTFKAYVGRDEDQMLLRAYNQREYPGTIKVSWQEVSRMAKVANVLAGEPKPRIPKEGRLR